MARRPRGPDPYGFVRDVMQSTPVRQKLDAVADRLAQSAQRVAQGESEDVPVQRVSGTRPKGRPYERVQVPAVNEHGDSKTKRIRLLGRALKGGGFRS